METPNEGPWCDLPERYEPCQATYDRCARWHRQGLYGQFLARFQIRMDAPGKIRLDLRCLDGSSIWANRATDCTVVA